MSFVRAATGRCLSALRPAPSRPRPVMRPASLPARTTKTCHHVSVGLTANRSLHETCRLPEPAQQLPEPEAVHVTHVGTDGHGCAKVSINAGEVVEVPVPNTLPGETVCVRLRRNRAPKKLQPRYKGRKRQSLAQTKFVYKAERVGGEAEAASPERVAPTCEHFGTCSGCQLQHWGYRWQLEWKEKVVKDELGAYPRLAGVRPLPTIASPKQYGYRSKLTPHFRRPHPDGDGVVSGIGFLHLFKPHEIVDVLNCPIATPAINAHLVAARENVRSHSWKRNGSLLLRSSGDIVCTDSNQVMQETVNGMVFEHRAGEFFQNNPFALPLLVEFVLRQAADGGRATHLVDAYCGAGLFSVCGSSLFRRCFGVDISKRSIACATRNALLNSATNCSFTTSKAEDIFCGLELDPDKTAVIIDPPRSGCSAEFLDQLDHLRPARLVYVSCNPTTQARDMDWLVQRGYKVASVQPVDMFPQTKHIECVATLEL